MKNKKMTINEAKKIPLDSFLERIGIPLSKVSNDGRDMWFLSPFRLETTPSLHVSVTKNMWFDFGKAEGITGGSIIDFCLEYFSPITIKEILERLTLDFSSFHQPQVRGENRVHKSSTIPKIKIVDIEEITHDPLIDYLANRGIDKLVAQKYCQQIGYVNVDKYYKSIGFENQSGGFELRSEGFKSCTSPKDITFYDNGFEKLAVFEGFIDFLSYQMLADFEIQNSNWLILNSLSFLSRINEIIKAYRQIFLFLDNDEAGRTAIKKIRQINPNYVDMTIMYADFKDLNDYLLWIKQNY